MPRDTKIQKMMLTESGKVVGRPGHGGFTEIRGLSSSVKGKRRQGWRLDPKVGAAREWHRSTRGGIGVQGDTAGGRPRQPQTVVPRRLQQAWAAEEEWG